MDKTVKYFRGSPYYGFRSQSETRRDRVRNSESSAQSERNPERLHAPKHSVPNVEAKLSRGDNTKRGLYVFRDAMISDEAYLPFLCSLREQLPAIKIPKE